MSLWLWWHVITCCSAFNGPCYKGTTWTPPQLNPWTLRRCICWRSTTVEQPSQSMEWAEQSNNLVIWQQNVNKLPACQHTLLSNNILVKHNIGIVVLQELVINNFNSSIASKDWITIYPSMHCAHLVLQTDDPLISRTGNLSLHAQLELEWTVSVYKQTALIIDSLPCDSLFNLPPLR
jgi:hypothetical protein